MDWMHNCDSIDPSLTMLSGDPFFVWLPSLPCCFFSFLCLSFLCSAWNFPWKWERFFARSFHFIFCYVPTNSGLPRFLYHHYTLQRDCACACMWNTWVFVTFLYYAFFWLCFSFCLFPFNWLFAFLLWRNRSASSTRFLHLILCCKLLLHSFIVLTFSYWFLFKKR